jgi:selenocysteine-specific elongation factor
MAQVVVGTAGHIDHGKTSLVKALTGTNTDRLAEEKKRGMTIDLGFAYLTESITIIDVPGHEKFIRNMAAGAANIHFGLLVIAADDGVMPQTREHLNILTLLGVTNGIVALTKTDLVNDDEWLDLVELDISELLEDIGFDSIAIHRINNLTGEGVEGLKSDILSMAENYQSTSSSPQFRLNVDRVFSKTGFGTVITGTVQNGSAKNGDEIEILPSGIKTKIRGLQTHGGATVSVIAGDRAALNLAHVKSSDLTRGTVLATPDCLLSTNRILANISMTNSTEWIIKNKQRVRFHIGTSEILGRVTGKKLEKGQSGNVIIDLESPVAVAMDDRFVVRSYSPMDTIAGGLVIDPKPLGKWSMLRQRSENLPIDPKKRFGYLIDEDWKNPKTKTNWQSLFFISNLILNEWIIDLHIMESKSGILYSESGLDRGKKDLKSYFDESYENNPFRTVLSSDGILNQLNWSEAWFEIVMKTMLKNDSIWEEKGGFSLSGYKPEFSQKDIEELGKIESILTQSGFEPILLKEITEASRFKPKRVGDLIHLLFAQGKVENLGNNFWLNRSNLDNVIQDIRDYFNSNEQLAVADFKEITGLSRKTAIPLLEYLDKKHFTVRQENMRLKGDALNG